MFPGCTWNIQFVLLTTVILVLHELFKFSSLMILNQLFDDIKRHHEFDSSLRSSLPSFVSIAEKLVNDLDISKHVEF